MLENYLTIKEVGEILDLTRARVGVLCLSGILKSEKQGHMHFIEKESFLEYKEYLAKKNKYQQMELDYTNNRSKIKKE